MTPDHKQSATIQIDADQALDAWLTMTLHLAKTAPRNRRGRYCDIDIAPPYQHTDRHTDTGDDQRSPYLMTDDASADKKRWQIRHLSTWQHLETMLLSAMDRGWRPRLPPHALAGFIQQALGALQTQWNPLLAQATIGGEHLIGRLVSVGGFDPWQPWVVEDAGKPKQREDDPERLWFQATQAGFCDLVELWIKQASGQALDENNALLSNVLLHHPKLVQACLARGANPNQCDNEGRVALMKARLPATMDLLLAAGADIQAVDNKGKSVLRYQMERGTSYCADENPVLVKGQMTLEHSQSFNQWKFLNRPMLRKKDIVERHQTHGLGPHAIDAVVFGLVKRVSLKWNKTIDLQPIRTLMEIGVPIGDNENQRLQGFIHMIRAVVNHGKTGSSRTKSQLEWLEQTVPKADPIRMAEQWPGMVSQLYQIHSETIQAQQSKTTIPLRLSDFFLGCLDTGPPGLIDALNTIDPLIAGSGPVFSISQDEEISLTALIAMLEAWEAPLPRLNAKLKSWPDLSGPHGQRLAMSFTRKAFDLFGFDDKMRTEPQWVGRWIEYLAKIHVNYPASRGVMDADLYRLMKDPSFASRFQAAQLDMRLTQEARSLPASPPNAQPKRQRRL